MPTSSADDDVVRVAGEIDRHIQRHWQEKRVVPSDPAGDAEFLRRVYLHITGCIPPVSVTREFLADTSPGKRRQVVEQLLDGSAYLVNFTRYWRRTVLPRGIAATFRAGHAGRHRHNATGRASR